MAKMIKWKKRLEERDNNIRWMNRRLFDLDHPVLYLGDEMNTFHFGWDDAIENGTIDEIPRILLMNLNATEKTLDAPALLMFYDELHTLKPSWIVERSLCPATSNDVKIMKQDGIRPFAVESKMSADSFDIICMSMDYYGNAVSIPWYLYESGIPLFSKERTGEDPFIVLGGAALYNPAPLRNLPGETQEDLNEFVELVRKIMVIFEKETLPGLIRPKLMISWTPLAVYPHSPLQWTKISRHLHADYSSLTERLKELGCYAYDTDITSDSLVHQLIMRGDSRLEGFLIQLAKEGRIRHNAPWPDEVLDSFMCYLSENNLPSLDEWFREYSYEDPLPWDLIRSPASRQYLWKRFQTMKSDFPENDPVCTGICSGCGGCRPGEKLHMKEIARLREQDAKIKPGHVMPKERHIPKQQVLMKFEYDLPHSFVFSSYWDCEIRRALNLAGIRYDPGSICTLGSAYHSDFSGAGPNLTSIALDERMGLTELKNRITEHALNFHIISLTEIDNPLRVTLVSYMYELPDGTDESTLSESVKEKLSQKEWLHSILANNRLSIRKMDFRPFVTDAFVKDGCLYFTSNSPALDPRRLVCCLMDLPVTSKLPSLPVRSGFEFDNSN